MPPQRVSFSNISSSSASNRVYNLPFCTGVGYIFRLFWGTILPAKRKTLNRAQCFGASRSPVWCHCKSYLELLKLLYQGFSGQGGTHPPKNITCTLSPWAWRLGHRQQCWRELKTSRSVPTSQENEGQFGRSRQGPKIFQLFGWAIKTYL